jgi:nitrate/TMAO reductase-like tetraheme cytochrome c subunit
MADEQQPAEPSKPSRHGFWHWLWQPPKRWYLLGIPAGAVLVFLLGIGFTIGILRAQLRFTESQEFCTSCHEMQTPFDQLQHSFHYSNEFGIRATCADCHLPPTLGADLLAHFAARADLWGHITGVIDTPEKFEQNKLRMAQSVWKEMKESNSASCRKCHSFAAMALDKQDPIAAKRHSAEYIAKTGKTCIDCHKGVAHILPQGM